MHNKYVRDMTIIYLLKNRIKKPVMITLQNIVDVYLEFTYTRPETVEVSTILGNV